jgi:hypothetical protein
VSGTEFGTIHFETITMALNRKYTVYNGYCQ